MEAHSDRLCVQSLSHDFVQLFREHRFQIIIIQQLQNCPALLRIKHEHFLSIYYLRGNWEPIAVDDPLQVVHRNRLQIWLLRDISELDQFLEMPLARFFEFRKIGDRDGSLDRAKCVCGGIAYEFKKAKDLLELVLLKYK